MQEDGLSGGSGLVAGGFPEIASFPPGVPVGAGPGGNNPPVEEPSLSDLLAEVRKMNLRSETNFQNLSQQIQQQASTFKSELAALRDDLRTEMVTRTMHAELEQKFEDRISRLEEGGVANAEIGWMKQQISKLDPANRSLAFREFLNKETGARTKCVEDFLNQIGLKHEIRSIEHVYTGPADNRTLSSVSIVEFASRTVRELALKKFEANPTLKDGQATVKVDRAKTSLQMKRNAALRRALDLIKKESVVRESSAVAPEIEWKTEGNKNRSVKFAGRSVFLQKPGDQTGHFIAPFLHLNL